jgi:hypothetical protein
MVSQHRSPNATHAPLWGYRMIHDVLRPQYPNINHKRVSRLYTAEGLSIRKRKKAKRIGVRVQLVAALAVNQTWSIGTFRLELQQAGNFCAAKAKRLPTLGY